MFHKAPPNEEARLRELVTGVKSRGTVMFVVDQPATIGGLPLAVAQAEGAPMGYLLGLAVRPIAVL